MSIFDRLRSKKPKTSEVSELSKLLDVIDQLKERRAYATVIEPTHRKEREDKTRGWREGATWQIGEKIMDRWEIFDIKAGGMGLVYLVRDPELDELYALKTYQEQFLWDEDAINRFMSEAENWVNLEGHTNIVLANSVLRIEGRPLILLEYIDGGDLKQWIGRISIPQALDFAIQFCTGMDYADKKLGIIHRDIKPGNVMITKDRVVKVTDFGLASALGERTEKLDLIPRATPSVSLGMGTLPYMPPEQFSKDIQRQFSFKPKPVTTRSDIYSLGVTFYQVLTGELPFFVPPSGDPEEIFTKRPTNPMQTNPRIPQQLGVLIMKCLEKDPKDRYRDFEQLKGELIDIHNDLTGEKYLVKGRKEDSTAAHWLLKGMSLTFLDKYDEAIGCFDKVILMEPTRADAWCNEGTGRINYKVRPTTVRL